jgi:DNA-binding GntR family transcriptional regulator
VNAPAVARTRHPHRVRREQLSDEVAGHLRAAIMTGTLRPGTFIRLDETAAQLGVSITPVREALRTLRGEGLVQLEPHRGHVVVPLSRRDVEDIFWLQATIAEELAKTALGGAVDKGDIDAITAAEFAFHRAFNQASGRIKLAWFLLHVARYLPPLVYASDRQWGAKAVANHRRLIAALRRRDVDSVVALTSWQFTDGARRLTDRLDHTGIWS